MRARFRSDKYATVLRLQSTQPKDRRFYTALTGILAVRQPMPRSRSQQCPQTNSQNRTPQGIRGQVPNVSIKLPVVNGVFGEGNYIVYLEGGSVVEDGFAGEGAEHLVTAVVYPEEFDAGGSVVHWGEGEVEAAFFVGQVPGIEIFFAEGEIYFAQFVGLSDVYKRQPL